MSKSKKTAQAAVQQEPATAAAVDQPMQAVSGDGAGQALPEMADQPVEQVAAAVPHPAAPGAQQEPEDLIDALVLCDGSLDGITRYRAGTLLQGVPEALAAANSHWLDMHPAAVEHAMANGAEVAVFLTQMP